jgi:hypothetical protein
MLTVEGEAAVPAMDRLTVPELSVWTPQYEALPKLVPVLLGP